MLSYENEAELLNLAAACSKDPLRFVMTMFPWGEEGTDLAKRDGPDHWQVKALTDIAEGLASGVSISEAVRIAIASGHGVGKSALVSWVILWAICTFEDTRGVVTANTDNQLRTKTWAELAKWYRLCLCNRWFQFTATALYSVDPKHEKTWRVDMVAWSERNTEAFAGLHNQGKRILLLFDEASAIPDIIWETAEGALTDEDTEIVWMVCGNPTRTVGRFRDCFGKFRHRWKTQQVDSRTVKITNKAQIAEWLADFGEDSDFFRIRVRGVFPRIGAHQFISSEIAEAATKREAEAIITDAFVLGCDIARFGVDKTVLKPRKGRDARTHPAVKLQGADTMTVAAKIAAMYEQHRYDAIFVDGGGVGGGVVDRLRQLKIPNVYEVQFGGESDRGFTTGSEQGHHYRNKRAEMYGSVRDWLPYGAIEDDPDLIAGLTGIEYEIVTHKGQDAILLESKKHYTERTGNPSPDDADALALTFAYSVQPSRTSGHAAAGAMHQGNMAQTEYDPFNPAPARVIHDYDPMA